jgi:hypothetical protein
MTKRNVRKNDGRYHFGWFFKLGKNVKILFLAKDNADGYYLESVLIIIVARIIQSVLK